MQFTGEVTWSGHDFAVFGTMLLAACGSYELGARMSRHSRYRAAIGIAVVAAFVLVWINLAVGIIGNENNPANLMYGGVLVVGVLGALIARFRPMGMAQVMIGMALAQAVAAVVVLVAGWGYDALMLSVLFAAPWLASAWLFRGVAQEQAAAGAG